MKKGILDFKDKQKKTITMGIVILIGVVGILAITLKPDKQVNVDEQSGGQSVAEVQITDLGFEPATLSIKAGTKVIWTNSDTSMHQISSNPHPTHESLPGLESVILNEGQTYEYTFNEAGSFSYHDEQNPIVNATIDVQN